jgi:predicted permease
MRTLLRDLQFGIRLFLSSPGFTTVAVLTLAVGIAANTTVFSWIDGLLLRPYPGAADGGRLAVMRSVTRNAPNGGTQLSYPDFRDYRANLKSLTGLAAHHEDVFSVGDAEHVEPVWGELVSGNYFDVLGLKLALGRTFTSEDEPVVVISEALWRRRFHMSPKVIGSTLRVNQHELTVIGVTPRGFRGTMPGLVFDLWTPLKMAFPLGMQSDRGIQARGNHWLYGLARLAPGVSVRQACAEAATYSRGLESAFPRSNRGVAAQIVPVWEFPGAAPSVLLKPLRILMAIALLLLLIVCANVANLLLARTIARRRELSIRLAVGAQRFHIARQLFTETVLLGAAAAVIGLMLAAWMGDVLPALIPKVGIHVAVGFALSWRVLAFTVGACLAAALLSGMMPALWWLRADLNPALKEGGRSGGRGLYSNRARGLLVVAEVAVATLAVVSAGLFVRSFQSARSIHPGFERDNLALVRFYLASTGFTADQTQQFSLRLRDQLRIAPGVAGAAYSDYAPLGASAGPYDEIAVQGYMPRPTESMQVNNYRVSPGYFAVMRTPLLDGRDFLETDDSTAPPVIIVNQTFARRYFGSPTAVGRRVKVGRVWTTVIATAQDSKYFDIAEAPRPHFFVSFRAQGSGTGQLYFLLRTASLPVAIAGLRSQVASVDGRAAAFDAMPFGEWSDITLLPLKVAASLASGLGLISLLVAAVGLYSVMAYAVSQRTQEIGIRMALGARPLDVLGDVLLRGMALTTAGLAAGMVAAIAVTRLISGMLVNVSATDPATFGGAAAFLIAVALLASYLPARRATHIDPIRALHCE